MAGWTVSSYENPSPGNQRHYAEHYTPANPVQYIRGSQQSPLALSDNSWPQEDFGQQSGYVSTKRALSPRVEDNGPNKRQQSYNSPGVLRSSRYFPEGVRPLFLPDARQVGRHQDIGLGLFSHEERHSDHREANAEYNASMRPPMQPGSRPSYNLPTRSIPRQSQSPAPQPHHPTPHEMDRSARKQTIDPQQLSNQRTFQRAQTVTPEFNPHYRNEQSPYTANSFHLKQPRLQPAIWSGRRDHGDDSRRLQRPEMLRGQDNDIIQAGSSKKAGPRPYFPAPGRSRSGSVHPPMSGSQHSRSQSIHPPTPAKYANNFMQDSSTRPKSLVEYTGNRVRSQSVYPETLDTNHRRDSSRPTQSTKFKVPKPNYGGLELEHPASVEDANPLEQVLRKLYRDGQQRQPHTENPSPSAAYVLPKEGTIYIKRGEQQPMKLDDTQSPAMKQYWRKPDKPFQNGNPDSPISVSSSREASIERPPLKRSLLMKDHIPLLKETSRAEARKSLTAVFMPKENVNVELDPEEVRQKMCADRIVAAEVKANSEDLDMQMFGDIIQLICQEQELKGEDKHAAARRSHQELMEEMLEKDATHLAEIKKQDQEEAVEKRRLLKEQEEERKKTKREAERKRQAAIDAEIVEEKRKKAEERIKADRARKAAELEQREKDKEKARAVELDQVKLELMKRDLEIKKLQAESLVRAKSSTTKPSTPLKTKGGPSRIMEDEDSLFIPEDQLTSHLPEQELYDVDERARLRAKSSDPTAIAKHFGEVILDHKYNVHEDRESFRTQKRLEEDKKRSENAKAKLAARYNAKSMPPESYPPQKRPQPTRRNYNTHTKSRPAKPKSNFKESESTLEAELEAAFGAELEPPMTTNLDTTLNTLPQPPIMGNPIGPGVISRPISAPTRKSPPVLLPPPALPQKKVYPSEVRLITDFEREKLEDQEKVLKDSQKQKRAEERRKKESDKARNNKQQKLLDEARKGGYTLNETEVNARVEQYMNEREEKYQKSLAKKALSQGETSSTPTLPIFTAHSEAQSCTQTQSQSPLQPPRLSFPSSSSSSVITESVEGETQKVVDVDTPETKDRKRRTADLKEHIIALNRTRGFRFAQTAAKCTVDDFQPDSDESEEDPDDEPTLESFFTIKKTQQPAQNDESDESSEDGSVNGDKIPNPSLEAKHSAALGPLNADEYGTQINESVAVTSSHIEGVSQGVNNGTESQVPPPPSSSEANKTKLQKPTQEEHSLVRVYTVEQTKIENAVEGQAAFVKMFTSRDDANSHAEEMIQDLRKQCRKPQSVQEGYDNLLFSGTVVFDKDNSITISVTSKITSSSTLANFDTLTIESKYVEKVWQIKRELQSAIQDGDTLEITRTIIKEDADDKLYTDRELANYHASLNFIAFIKPGAPKIDDIIQHESKWAPLIREKRSEADKAEECFNFQISAGDGELDWMDWGLVRYWVVVREVTGPKN